MNRFVFSYRNIHSGKKRPILASSKGDIDLALVRIFLELSRHSNNPAGHKNTGELYPNAPMDGMMSSNKGLSTLTLNLDSTTALVSQMK
jgi:hypothetical protein